MKISFIQRIALLAALAAAMFATRECHVGALPDASWAVFFLGGFYFSTSRAFLLLMAEAIAIDYVATQHLGISSYCISPAYVFLLPAHGALWFGGRWLRGHRSGLGIRSVSMLAASLFVAVSTCFLVSNGSFYWLSGRAATPTFAGWAANFGHWYFAFLSAPFAYVGMAAVLHVLAVSLIPARAASMVDRLASR